LTAGRSAGDSCPACAAAALASWRTAPASEPAQAAVRFALLRCPSCGTAVTAGPPPAFDAAHEAGAYAARVPRLSRAAAPVLRAFDRRRLGLLARAVGPPGTLVDAGAGRGRFVAAARAAGWDATGIEPSRRGVEAALAAYGVTLEPAAIETARVAPGSLDAVCLWHVLEHLEDPGSAVERVAGWLAPGGAVIVGVPNLASLQARIGGERWFHLDVPRHRVHFTPAGLRALLARHGLDVAGEEHVLAEHNPFGLWQSAVSRLTRTPAYLFNVLKRNARADPRDLAVTLLALPLIPVAALVELVAGLAGRGGTIAVTAVRREAVGTGTAPPASGGRRPRDGCRRS
jgi:SAM-dependent methyltransferase